MHKNRTDSEKKNCWCHLFYAGVENDNSGPKILTRPFRGHKNTKHNHLGVTCYIHGIADFLTVFVFTVLKNCGVAVNACVHSIFQPPLARKNSDLTEQCKMDKSHKFKCRKLEIHFKIAEDVGDACIQAKNLVDFFLPFCKLGIMKIETGFFEGVHFA